ncbi:MAG: class I SAM-dependent methyltransferase [Candidatus Nitrotoga sp.]
MSEYAVTRWLEGGAVCSARWRSESGLPPPGKIVIADDTMKADVAYRLACEGTALLWRGDFQNAKQLLQALARRADKKPHKTSAIPGEAFHLYRQAQSQRARILVMILIPLASDYSIALNRAPDVRQACVEAYGAGSENSVLALRELLGIIGAHEWRKKGVAITALNADGQGSGAQAVEEQTARIYPHYGVFSPVRGEYVELVRNAPLPPAFPVPQLAFDIGTGTGVLAAILARRGVQRVIATEQDPRAIVCARENITRLGLNTQVQIVQADLFPAGKAQLIVCNPPWIPARPNSSLEHAIFDPGSRMLRGFLHGLAAHLEPGGEGWLILSDIAEHLGLRTRNELLATINAAGLTVLARLDVQPHHPRAADTTDPLYAARAAEITSLWRLAGRGNVESAFRL